MILVPASTWFVMNSLRKARETVIPPDENINIYVQSLVKIYERENRWAREWKAGAKIRERLGLEKTFQALERYDTGYHGSCRCSAFMIYFTYFYLDKGFWIFLFSITTMVLPFSNMEPVQGTSSQTLQQMETEGCLKDLSQSLISLFSGLSLFLTLYMFQLKWENIAVVLILGFLWFTGLFIYKTGQKLSKREY
ncbi:MAG: hypothetical protein MZV63_70110 [Marinilabiliales bacterium]|nr:hypothetical protein [Marinilabiliales bacterium]